MASVAILLFIPLAIFASIFYLDDRHYNVVAVLILFECMMPFMVSAESITLKTLTAYYITGLPMDLVHAFGTALFIMIAAEPMLEKMDRIKVKYGLAE